MKCSSCGAQMLPPTRTDDVRYPCGLDVRLNNVWVHRCPACGEEEVDIPNPGALHRCLASQVSAKVGRLTHEEIRFLRKHLGWSGVDFARRFRTTPQTITRWESGEFKMNRQADLLLRVLATVLPPIRSYPEEGLLPDDLQVRAIELASKLVEQDSDDCEGSGEPLELSLKETGWGVPGSNGDQLAC